MIGICVKAADVLFEPQPQPYTVHLSVREWDKNDSYSKWRRIFHFMQIDSDFWNRKKQMKHYKKIKIASIEWLNIKREKKD